MHQCTVVVCCKSVTQKNVQFWSLGSKTAPFLCQNVVVFVRCVIVSDSNGSQYGFHIFLHLPHLFVHTWSLIYFMAPFLHILDYFTTVAYPICRLWRKIAFHLLDPFCTPFLTCKVRGPKMVIVYFSIFLYSEKSRIFF